MGNAKPSSTGSSFSKFRMIDEQDAIQRHIRIFINREQVRGIDIPLSASDEVQIFQALSGG